MNCKTWRARLARRAGRPAHPQGRFAVAMAALAVAAAVAVNLLAAQLPEAWSRFDLTGSGIYDITDTSREYLAGLTEDVEIHVLASEDSLDSRITRFLALYEELSGRLTVEYVDPDVYPSALSTYGVEANTVVVTCEATGRQESFSVDEIIGYDIMSYYMYGTPTETDFDAEGLLTSAVDAVLTGAARTVYQTEGHEETALPQSVTDQMDKAHLAVEAVNLLTAGGVPEDCDVLVICAPQRDLAADETAWVESYLAAGGQVVCLLSSAQTPNLTALLARYGIQVQPGLAADMERYYLNTPYAFFPLADTSVDLAADLSGDAPVLFYGAVGMTLTEPEDPDLSVSSFLTTSSSGYVVTEEGQTQGTYAVGVLVRSEAADQTEEDADQTEESGMRLTVFGCVSPVDESLLTQFPSLDNAALFLQALTAGFSDVGSVDIQPVSLSTPMNTIPTAGIWALVFVLVIPGMVALGGLIHWTRRRRL